MQLYFFEPATQELPQERVVNVASVPQRSPFRYPGGKTWLVPVVRKWMRGFDPKSTFFIEPFAGGGIVGLTVAFENMAQKVTLVELDEEVAAVWETMLNGGNEWLANRILNFDLSHENVQRELERENKTTEEIAFATILKNRVFHGGILAKGSGLIKNGENGKGLGSRWYPQTLKKRISAIGMVKQKIEFIKGDAFEMLEKHLENQSAVFFIDPPYTIAGKRLYTHFDIDHEKLFALASRIRGHFMLTYDDTEEVRFWAEKYRLPCRTVPMKTTHHLEKNELLITNDNNW
ncbi:MAG: DNA adenine methylase [Saprospiraceae bacterium]